MEQLAAILSQKIGDTACEVIPVEMVGICSQRQEKHLPFHVAKGGRPVDITDKAFWQACVWLSTFIILSLSESTLHRIEFILLCLERAALPLCINSFCYAWLFKLLMPFQLTEMTQSLITVKACHFQTSFWLPLFYFFLRGKLKTCSVMRNQELISSLPIGNLHGSTTLYLLLIFKDSPFSFNPSVFLLKRNAL